MSAKVSITRNVPTKVYNPRAGDGGEKYIWTDQQVTIEVDVQQASQIPDAYVAAVNGFEEGSKKFFAARKSARSQEQF